MTIKINFKREIAVDLNAYYPSFTRSLRTAIDDELFALLGGTRLKKPPKQKEVIKEIIFKGTGKKPLKPNSKLAAVVADIGTKEWVRADIEKMGALRGMQVSSTVANLLNKGYIKGVE